jgi:methyl-accepting chemotaxis protein
MFRLANVSIRAKFMLLVAVFAAGFTGFLFVLFATTSSRLEDSDYVKIVVRKDLIADIIPPPLSVMEPYLVLHELAGTTDSARSAELTARFESLRTGYAQRQAYWKENLPPGPLADRAQHGLDEAADAFFQVADEQFFPAFQAGDRARMEAALDGPVSEAYRRQAAAIDDLNVATQAEIDKDTTEAASNIEDRKWTLAVFGGAIVLLGSLFGHFVSTNLSRRVQTTVDGLRRVAGGDFSDDVEDLATDELGQMAQALNQAVQSIRAALKEVQEFSAGLTTSAQELTAAAQTIAAGASEQAASLEETAASLEEITATVRQSSDNANHASQLAVGSREAAERGGTVVERAVTAMSDINDSSSRIEEIIATIDEIAFQTNILALNAAVEAARAGDQGRGFAVVAEQVGHLSERSAAAAKEIKALIQDSQRKVSGGTELVNRSGNSLQEIVTSVRRVTDIVGEMAAAFREQSTGLSQVNVAVTQMGTVTQANSAQTEELSATAATLAENAEQMRRLVSAFRLGDEGPTAILGREGRLLPSNPTGPAARPAARRDAPPARRPARPARPARPIQAWGTEDTFVGAAASAMDAAMDPGTPRAAAAPTAASFEEL